MKFKTDIPPNLYSKRREKGEANSKSKGDDNLIFDAGEQSLSLDELWEMVANSDEESKKKLDETLTALELKQNIARLDNAREEVAKSLTEKRKKPEALGNLDPWRLLPEQWREHLLRHQRILDEKEKAGGTGRGSEYMKDPWADLPERAQKYLRRHQRILDEQEKAANKDS